MQSRQILVSSDYLHIPIHPGEHDRHALQIWLGGTLLREFYLSLASPGEGAYFFLNVSAFAEKPLTFILPKPDGLADDILNGIMEGDAPTVENPLYPDLYQEPLRPRFHFSTKRGWLNDPNGLVYADGWFHLYYQHNPMGTPHGGVNICWGHAVSRDLLHWTELNDAIVPWRRDWSIASGSALVDDDGVAGYGKGAIIAAFTALGTYNEIPGRRYASGGQFLAASSDGGYTFYLFNTQAAVPTDNGEGWRDPRLIRYQDGFVMAVYETLDGRNCVSIYTSQDLRSWTRSSRNMDLYECPDLFELATPEGETRWIMYGADGYARIGWFDGKAFIESGDAHPLDYGKAVYAGQTWNHHPQGKRVHISWIFGMDGYRCEESFEGSPFSQCMSIPCELALVKQDTGFRVLRNPVGQLTQLRDGEPEHSVVQINGIWVVPLEPQSEYLFEVGIPHGDLIFQAGTHELRHESYTNTLCFDQNKTCALSRNALSIRLLVDTTTMEFFINEGIAATYTMHPSAMSLRIEGHAEIRCTRWPLKTIW